MVRSFADRTFQPRRADRDLSDVLVQRHGRRTPDIQPVDLADRDAVRLVTALFEQLPRRRESVPRGLRNAVLLRDPRVLAPFGWQLHGARADGVSPAEPRRTTFFLTAG